MSDTTEFARSEWIRSPEKVDTKSALSAAPIIDFYSTTREARDVAEHRKPLDGTGNAVARSKPIGGKAKRLLDIAVATSALVLVAPLMLTVAAMLKLSGGDIFFVHDRIGFGGRTFRCLKFRSMVANPEKALEAHLAADPEARTEWDHYQKLKRDPRITPFGQALRRSSIDELPQLLNILRGDMSCVGPRPVTRDELSRYGLNAGLYLQVRPGLTGLWQTSGRNQLSYPERVELDSHYVTNWSFRRDLAILFRTIGAVMRTYETS